MLTITYDRLLDRKCGGAFEPSSGILTQPPTRGEVTFGQGKFLYAAGPMPSGSDYFVLTGTKDNLPYKLTVNVQFK